MGRTSFPGTLLLVLLSVLWVSGAEAQGIHGGAEFRERMEVLRSADLKPFDQFYSAFLGALQGMDLDQLSGLVRYPLSLSVGKQRITVRDARAFRRVARLALTDSFVRSLLAEKDDLYCLSKGVALGKGDVWFNTVAVKGKDTWRIVAINN